MATKSRAPLGVELVKRGVVTEETIEKAIEYQKSHATKKIGDILNILQLVPQKELSLAIGRSGQNIKLAAKLIGKKLNIITEEEDNQLRNSKFKNASELFIHELDVDEVIGQLLASYGYNTIREIAKASVEMLANIEGFDEDIALEIKNRALENLGLPTIKNNDEINDEE